MKRFAILSLGTLVAGLVLSTATVSAQGFGGGRGQGQGRGNFDPAEMQARMAEMMKERLKVSEDEWKVIQPLLEKVQTKQRESMGGRFRGAMMFGGRGQGGPAGGPGGGNANAQNRPQRDRPGMDEVQALNDALEAENTSAADLKAKMAAVRDARKKSESELKTAREDLRKVLTTRQEATLMVMGVLD